MKDYTKEIEIIINYYKNEVNQNRVNIYNLLIKDYLKKIKNYFSSNIKSFKRSQSFTKERYNRIWNKTDLYDYYNPKFKNNLSIHSFKKKYFLSSNSLTTRVQQYLMIDKINEFKPLKVLEVGCGQGFQLLLLSRLFPKISFIGIDQSEVGINFANSFKNELLDEILTKPLDYKFNDVKEDNLEYSIQDAKKIKIESNSVDLVFTNLALEQMDNIKFEVISEIKRVSKKYIILIEPFKDLNDKGIKYLHHSAKRYFNLRYNELADNNFKIVEYQNSFPNLISLGYGMLVLKKNEN